MDLELLILVVIIQNINFKEPEKKLKVLAVIITKSKIIIFEDVVKSKIAM